MAIQIEDGKGSGLLATVDTDNRLEVNAANRDEEHVINEEGGKVWSIPFEGLNPAGADDYVVYIKNTGDTTIYVSEVDLSADSAATQVEIHAVSGTASGGTAISPVSRTIGSAALPTATIESGTDITGLTNDGIIAFMQLAVVNTQYSLDEKSKIRIPKGKAVALLVETGTANITGMITLAEELL